MVLGLHTLHSHDIAHRDLKPSNVVFDEYFCLKLIDFDTAAFLETSHMQSRTRLGTPEFMAPELRTNMTKAYDAKKADIASLGFTLIFLLTG